MDEFGKKRYGRTEKELTILKENLKIAFITIISAVFFALLIIGQYWSFGSGQTTSAMDSEDKKIEKETKSKIKNLACASLKMKKENGFENMLCEQSVFDDDEELEKDALARQSGSGAIVIEQYTKKVLNEQNAHQRLYPASTTKVLTALCVIQNKDLNEMVTIPKKASGVEGSSIYLLPGEKLTVRELLYGLMLRSGNDAATALALTVCSTIEEFANVMNKTALACGAKNSNFCNPHGLQDENHYTTAYDLAMITAKAFEYKEFREIVGSKFKTISGKEQKRYLKNKNKILWRYKGGNGVKTGYTKTSGRCLVAAAKRNGMQVIAVVLNHNAMWNDAQCLMNFAFDNYEFKNDYYSIYEQQNGDCDDVKIIDKDPPVKLRRKTYRHKK